MWLTLLSYIWNRLRYQPCALSPGYPLGFVFPLERPAPALSPLGPYSVQDSPDKMSSPMLIDDSNTAVQYDPGWIWDQLVHDEVDHTRHGAAITGISTRLGFTGTGIDVIGTLEPTDRNGLPSTAYSIDGKNISTYTAPITTSSTLNVTFFSNRDLNPGDHEIVITNLNGSSPNVFWLDFFLVYSSTSDDSGVTPSTSSSPSLPTSASSSSDPVAATGVPTDTNLSAESTSSGTAKSNVGAIVGSVIGGLACLLLFGIFLMLWRKRNRPAAKNSDHIAPFTHVSRAPFSPSHPSTSTFSQSFPSTDNAHSASHEMIFNAAAIASRPPMSMRMPDAASTINTSNFTEVSSTDPPLSQSALNTALPSSATLPHSHTAHVEAKLHESIYGSSSALPDSGSSAHQSGPSPATARSELFPASSPVLTSETDPSSTSPVSPSLDSATSLVHAEVSRAPWTAPAERQSRAQSLLRAFSMRNDNRTRTKPSNTGVRGGASTRDVDSGLRLYSEAALPPPYTPE
ncbi:hypothetical protein C8Q80DRAFT_303726 [Daedaleopsis nitida]|nr:hypothetical protein C8Q80DRAFT_303726 [Daedaleopsis nitida]